MKAKQFSPQQISSVLTEYDQGKNVMGVIQAHGISKTTFYKWRKRYANMSSDDLKKLKALEDENRKLKHIYAGLALELKLMN